MDYVTRQRQRVEASRQTCSLPGVCLLRRSEVGSASRTSAPLRSRFGPASAPTLAPLPAEALEKRGRAMSLCSAARVSIRTRLE